MLHLARALLLADAVAPEALAEALVLAAAQGTSLARGLVAAHAIDTPGLEAFLEQYLEGSPAPGLTTAVPLMDLALRLPPDLCERLQAVPVRRDPLTGTVDVAVVDARDPHPAHEIAHFLRAPVRLVRTSLASMEAALVKVHAERVRGARPPAPPAAFAAPLPDADVAIPLTRRSPGAAANAPAAAPPPPEPPVAALAARVGVVVPAPEPVLDLRRRKAEPTPAPPTTRGPPPAPPPPADPAAALAAMAGAADRDAILDLLVAGALAVAREAAVLAVRRDALVGWTCSPGLARREAFRGVLLPNARPTVLHEALRQAGARTTPLPRDERLAPLAAVAAPALLLSEVAVAPVHAAGKPVAVVLALGLTGGPASPGRLGDLARAAGESLERLLRERRK